MKKLKTLLAIFAFLVLFVIFSSNYSNVIARGEIECPGERSYWYACELVIPSQGEPYWHCIEWRWWEWGSPPFMCDGEPDK